MCHSIGARFHCILTCCILIQRKNAKDDGFSHEMKKKVNIDSTSSTISQKQWMKLESRSFKSNLNGALHLKCGLLHNNIIIMWDNNGISSFLAKHFRVYSIHTDAQFYSWLTWWCYLLIILCVCVHKPEIGESEANLHNACGRKRYQSQCFSKRKINCEQKE